MSDHPNESLDLARPEHSNEQIERHLDALQDHLQYQDGDGARDHGALCLALAQMLAIALYQASKEGDEMRQTHQATTYIRGVVAALSGDKEARAVIEMTTAVMVGAARSQDAGAKPH